MDEKKIISMIISKTKGISKNTAVGIGDDCAIMRYNKKQYLLSKICSQAENNHFSLKWSTPEQIGMKAIEASVSDIAAMGGTPKYALISLALPFDFNYSFIDRLYNGIIKKSKKYRIKIIGGDTVNSKNIVVTVSLIGLAEKKYLALRSNAQAGDLIFCTGDVGKSAAGLELLKQNKQGKSIKKHLEPESRPDLARKLAKASVKAMIDVSDGVFYEVEKMCSASNVGAVIHANKLPISKTTINDAKKTNKNPVGLALYGGEDFELVFTASKRLFKKLKKYDATLIGNIVAKKGVKSEGIPEMDIPINNGLS